MQLISFKRPKKQKNFSFKHLFSSATLAAPRSVYSQTPTRPQSRTGVHIEELVRLKGEEKKGKIRRRELNNNLTLKFMKLSPSEQLLDTNSDTG